MREPFSAIDAHAAPAGVAVTRAGSRQLEAGFQDQSLGWVGVRADLNAGGGVHASLLPSTADAAQTLGAHLDGLHHYLAEQRTPVDSLLMASPGNGGSSGMGGGTGQGTQQGTAQDAGQNTGQEPGQNARPGPNQSNTNGVESGRADSSAAHSRDAAREAPAVAEGRRISLIA
jgi:hypothetical protein